MIFNNKDVLWSHLDLGASVCGDFYEIESPSLLERLGDLCIGQSAILDGLNHIPWSNIASIGDKGGVFSLNNECAFTSKAERGGAYTETECFAK